MRYCRTFLLACAVFSCLLGQHPPAHAAITPSGNVEPVTDPATWTSSIDGYIGKTADGSLTVDLGSDLISKYGYIGYNSGVSGVVTVDGAGSTWTNSNNLYVGLYGSGRLGITTGGTVTNSTAYIGFYSGSSGTVTVDGPGSIWTNSGNLDVGSAGSGTLNIFNAGAVSVTGATYVDRNAVATGLIDFGPSGGILATQTFYASPSQLLGSGAINTRGLVSDVDLMFDATHGLVQTLSLDSLPGQHVALNVDIGTSPGTNGDLGIGLRGSGTLTIRDGLSVSSANGYLGYNSGASGIASVEGNGSTWTVSGNLCVGYFGCGTLNIGHNGIVSIAGKTYVDYATYQGSTIHFAEGGGTLITQSLLGAPSQLTGTGTINTRGLVSDLPLVFDSGHGLNQVFRVNSLPAQDITINLDLATSPSSNGVLGAGVDGAGSLTIRQGVLVNSEAGYLGYRAGSNGIATVDGASSRWSISNTLSVGHQGDGTLNISNGGCVQYGSNCYVGNGPGASGVVNVSGANSSWRSNAALYLGFLGSGVVNITNGGSASISSVVIGYVTGSLGSASVDGKGSLLSTTDLVVWRGTVTVTGGGALTSLHGSIGAASSSLSLVSVQGSGSTWNNWDDISIGIANCGTLLVTGGATVGDTTGYIAKNTGSTGNASVDGIGSKWTSSGTMYVGQSGIANLNISGGAEVSALSISINNQSLLAIDAGAGSKLVIKNGTGMITNNGKVRVLAGPTVVAGLICTPILAWGWSGAGTYQAVGGTWQSSSHAFTASAVQTGAGGTAVNIDLMTKQRVLVSDSATGWNLGASFLAKTVSTPLSVTATALSGTDRTGLEQTLGAGKPVLGGWQFAATGYTAGEPVYLSFDIGANYSRSVVSVWRYSGTAWASYAASDLTYDGQYASFSVVDMNGYALAGPLTRSWTGGSTTGNNWSDSGNWNNAIDFAPSDTVVLAGTTRTTPVNDLLNQQVAGLQFAAAAGMLQLGGNALKIAGKIDNQATAKQEINLPIVFVAGIESGTVNVVSGGELKISHSVSGAVGLTKTGPGRLELTQDAAYSGNTAVLAGVLELQGLSNSGSTTVGDGTASAQLFADYVRQTAVTIRDKGKVTITGGGGASGTSVIGSLSIALPGNSVGQLAGGVEAVPEPGTLAMLVVAIAGVLMARVVRRHRLD